MGLNTPHALGLNQIVWTRPEATFGTFVAPIGTETNQGYGRLRVKDFSITPDDGGDFRRDRNDTRLASRSLLERIPGRIRSSWSLETYAFMEPNADGTVQPTLGGFLKAGMGGAVNGSGETQFNLGSGQTSMTPLSITNHANEVVQQALAGAFVDVIGFRVQGGDEPMFTFSGPARQHILTGYTTVNNGGPYTTTDTMTVTDSRVLEVGSVVKIGTNLGLNNNGLKVSAVNYATHSITVVNAEDNSAVSISGSDADAVVPFVPTTFAAAGTATEDPSPIAGINGSITIDGVSVPITAFSVEINNNARLVDDQAFEQLISDVIPGIRSVTGEVSFRARRDLVLAWAKNKQVAIQPISLICGTGAGNMIEWYVRAEFDLGSLSFGGIEEEGIVTASYTAVATSTGEDECWVKWT